MGPVVRPDWVRNRMECGRPTWAPRLQGWSPDRPLLPSHWSFPANNEHQSILHNLHWTTLSHSCSYFSTTRMQTLFYIILQNWERISGFNELPIYVFLPLNSTFVRTFFIQYLTIFKWEFFLCMGLFEINDKAKYISLFFLVNAICNYARLVSYLDIYVINSCCAFRRCT